MVERNTDSLQTAYTISCDYKHGTTTGISAHDRALTVKAIGDDKIGGGHDDAAALHFTRPGHVFPLRYTEGGVLKRGKTRRKREGEGERGRMKLNSATSSSPQSRPH